MLTGTPGLILAGLPELINTDWNTVSIMSWIGLLYASILALVTAYAIWNTSVRVVGSSKTAIYACITPVVAALISWFQLNERLVPLQIIGAALIISGILFTRRKTKDGKQIIHNENEIHVSA
jgi:drug/metabolite transporter (DMT)-like permease